MTALWKALYTAGHDAALVREHDDGWRLEGMAVYARESEPACLRYLVELERDWSARAGSIHGFVGSRPVSIRLERDANGWTLNGVRQEAVAGLVDLDFGFTPATNHPQLRRMALDVGQTKRIDVAWLDVDSAGLEPLPQIYTRIADDAYDYDSPQGPYRATLRLAPNGFVSLYPELWHMEGGTAGPADA